MTLMLLMQLCGATAGLALLVRASPWPKSWLQVKPLGCSVCLPGHTAWMTLLYTQTWLGWQETALVYFCMTAVGAVIMDRLFPPQIELPE